MQTLFMDSSDHAAQPPRRLETRVLLRQEGEWAGYSYRWRDDQSDADLVARDGQDLWLSEHGFSELAPPDSSGAPAVASADTAVPAPNPSADPHAASDPHAAADPRGQAWRIPNRTECLTCHSRAVGFVLGMSALQLDRDIDLDGERRNQLLAWKEREILTETPDELPTRERGMVSPYDTTKDLDSRARSYLHANCSMCHVEAGGGNAQMELEFSREADAMRLLGVRPQHDTFYLANAMLVAPGAAQRSVLLHRLQLPGRGRMPPLGSRLVDAAAVQLFHDWIGEMPPIDKIIQNWRTEDLIDDLVELESGRSFERGRDAFQSVGCRQCHRFHGEGGTVGPDLTGSFQRLSPVKLLESIIDPSKDVADEYATYQFVLHAGLVVVGQIDREDEQRIVVRTGTGLADVVELAPNDVEDRVKSPISNMPAETLNVLERQQILDLLAFLLADGNADSPRFQPTP